MFTFECWFAKKPTISGNLCKYAHPPPFFFIPWHNLFLFWRCFCKFCVAIHCQRKRCFCAKVRSLIISSTSTPWTKLYKLTSRTCSFWLNPPPSSDCSLQFVFVFSPLVLQIRLVYGKIHHTFLPKLYLVLVCISFFFFFWSRRGLRIGRETG